MVQGLGFRVQGLEFRVQGSGFRVQGLGFRVQGLGFRVHGVGLWVYASGSRVLALGFRSKGLQFTLQGEGLRGDGQRLTVQGSTGADTLFFERLRIWHPQKDDLSRYHQECTLMIIFLGCQLAKCPTAKRRPGLYRPTVQWEMAKSLIARKDRGSARVVNGGRVTVTS